MDGDAGAILEQDGGDRFAYFMVRIHGGPGDSRVQPSGIGERTRQRPQGRVSSRTEEPIRLLVPEGRLQHEDGALEMGHCRPSGGRLTEQTHLGRRPRTPMGPLLADISRCDCEVPVATLDRLSLRLCWVDEHPTKPILYGRALARPARADATNARGPGKSAPTACSVIDAELTDVAH
jgi:hypothetical protein